MWCTDFAYIYSNEVFLLSTLEGMVETLVEKLPSNCNGIGRDICTHAAAKTNALLPRPVIEQGTFTAEVMEAMRAKHAILISQEEPPLTSYPRHAPHGSTAIVKRHTMHNTEPPRGAPSHALPTIRRGSQPQVSGSPSQPSRHRAAPTAMLSSLV